jgi:hypothetical protein
MPIVERRVVGEVIHCLDEFANGTEAHLPTSLGRRYPWPAAILPAAPPNYVDTIGARFGRVPDPLFNGTDTSLGSPTPPHNSWGITCAIKANGWWPLNNWKEMVFYAVAEGHQPSAPTPGCPNCLQLNPPSPTADKQVVILAAGRQIGTQARNNDTDKSTVSNYLEGENTTTPPSNEVFAKGQITTTFNDQSKSWPTP